MSQENVAVIYSALAALSDPEQKSSYGSLLSDVNKNLYGPALFSPQLREKISEVLPPVVTTTETAAISQDAIIILCKVRNPEGAVSALAAMPDKDLQAETLTNKAVIHNVATSRQLGSEQNENCLGTVLTLIAEQPPAKQADILCTLGTVYEIIENGQKPDWEKLVSIVEALTQPEQGRVLTTNNNFDRLSKTAPQELETIFTTQDTDTQDKILTAQRGLSYSGNANIDNLEALITPRATEDSSTASATTPTAAPKKGSNGVDYVLDVVATLAVVAVGFTACQKITNKTPAPSQPNQLSQGALHSPTHKLDIR